MRHRPQPRVLPRHRAAGPVRLPARAGGRRRRAAVLAGRPPVAVPGDRPRRRGRAGRGGGAGAVPRRRPERVARPGVPAGHGGAAGRRRVHDDAAGRVHRPPELRLLRADGGDGPRPLRHQRGRAGARPRRRGARGMAHDPVGVRADRHGRAGARRLDRRRLGAAHRVRPVGRQHARVRGDRADPLPDGGHCRTAAPHGAAVDVQPARAVPPDRRRAQRRPRDRADGGGARPLRRPHPLGCGPDGCGRSPRAPSPGPARRSSCPPRSSPAAPPGRCSAGCGRAGCGAPSRASSPSPAARARSRRCRTCSPDRTPSTRSARRAAWSRSPPPGICWTSGSAAARGGTSSRRVRCCSGSCCSCCSPARSRARTSRPGEPSRRGTRRTGSTAASPRRSSSPGCSPPRTRCPGTTGSAGRCSPCCPGRASTGSCSPTRPRSASPTSRPARPPGSACRTTCPGCSPSFARR